MKNKDMTCLHQFMFYLLQFNWKRMALLSSASSGNANTLYVYNRHRRCRNYLVRIVLVHLAHRRRRLGRVRYASQGIPFSSTRNSCLHCQLITRMDIFPRSVDGGACLTIHVKERCRCARRNCFIFILNAKKWITAWVIQEYVDWLNV